MRSSGPASILAILPGLFSQYGESKVREQLNALQRHGDAVENPQLWLETALAHDFKFTPIHRLEKCPCGSQQSVLLCRFIFWNLLGVRQCQDCGLIYLSPRLTQEAMYQLFNVHYFNYAEPEFWGVRRRPIFRDIVRLLRRYNCHKVFDVGAAYGHFVAWAAKYGIEAAGCDISAAAVKWGRSSLGVTLHHGFLSDLDLQPDSVDCVVSLDTFYYVADPVRELQAMRRLVKPGGWVVLRLRNGLRTLARARKEGSKPIGQEVMPSEHLWAFTPATIARLMTSCDLAFRAYEPAAYSYTPLAPLHVAWVLANRLLAAPPLRMPILTLSFNAIAQRLA